MTLYHDLIDSGYFEYRGQLVRSFEQFRKLKIEQRTKDKIPDFDYSTMPPMYSKNEITRDFYEYLQRGGAESPELRKEVFSTPAEVR